MAHRFLPSAARCCVVLTATTLELTAAAAQLPAHIPAHAYVDTSGAGWACNFGYRASNDTCVSIDVPENAHLDYAGHDRICNRPYRKRGDRCEAL